MRLRIQSGAENFDAILELRSALVAIPIHHVGGTSGRIQDTARVAVQTLAGVGGDSEPEQ